MDAVELPLAANVAVSKLLAADGFGRVGESENGPDSSVFGGHKAAGCGSYPKGIKCPPTAPEHTSVSRNEGCDVELHLRGKVPSFRREDNGNKRHRLGEADQHEPLLVKPEVKQLNRKSVKNLGNLPCSKRSKLDQPEHSMKTGGSDACDDTSRKTGFDITSCSSTERTRPMKQKRCQDTKRTDKRNSRAGGKCKYEAGFCSSDTASGANNILGIYGLKSDFHDFTELVDEVSLTELLDGSFKYTKLFPGKGRKNGNASESTLVSVRKACTILTSYSAADGNDSRKDGTSILNINGCSGKISDCDTIDKCMGETESTKVKDPGQVNVKKSILYHPKEVLVRLALPPSQDLDSLILDSNIPSVVSQSSIHSSPLRRASLPPFPWSFSQNGACRSIGDSNKLSSTRIACQGRWVRISSSTSSFGEESSSSSELHARECNNKEGPSNQQKKDELLRYVNSFSLCDSPRQQPPNVCHNVCEVNNITSSMDGSGVLGPCSPFTHKFLQEHGQCSEGDFMCQEKERKFDDSLSNKISCTGGVVGHDDHSVCYTKGCPDSFYPCKSTSVGCNQSSWVSRTSEIHKSACTPRDIAAAEALCYLANSFNAIRTGDHSDGSSIPKASPQKTMKARRSASSVGKTDEPVPITKHHDSVKSAGISSAKHNLISLSDKGSTLINGVGSGSPARWSLSSEVVTPGKLDRDPPIYAKPSLGNCNSVRPFIPPMRALSRFEREYDSQHKFRNFGGSSIKDWSRGRNKRL